MTEQPIVQIFGLRDSRPTQKALRFFSERRVQVSFVDLAKRPIAAGELRRFSQRFGAAALADAESKAFQRAGLAWLRQDEDQWTERLLAEPRLIRLPLVRAGHLLAVGDDPTGWAELLVEA